MKFTLTKAVWTDMRPRCAKNSGVAGALKALTAATAKKTSAMTVPEVSAAREAMHAMFDALDTAVGKTRKANRKGEHDDFLRQIEVWRADFQRGHDKIRVALYEAKVRHVQGVFDRSYANTEDQFRRACTQADDADRAWEADASALPHPKYLQNWMGAVRDMQKFSSKQGIAKLSVDYIREIKVSDLRMPDTLKSNKTRAKTLMAQCERFAKLLKRGTKNLDAGLSDTKAVERELKAILVIYKRLLADNKAMIGTAKALQAEAKALAGRVKGLVSVERETPIADPRAVATAVSDLARRLKTLREDNVRLHFTYRDSKGDLARRSKTFRAMDGYNQKTHGDMVTRIQSNCQIAIRQVTVPLADGERQILRCREYMKASNGLRGFV